MQGKPCLSKLLSFERQHGERIAIESEVDPGRTRRVQSLGGAHCRAQGAFAGKAPYKSSGKVYSC